jgi:hypothetical protein
MGNSYQEICDATGWTYTKVNRCLAEGRKSFLARYAGIEEGEECRRWAPVLSAMVDGEASADQVLELRPHLRNCAGCRAALRELRGSNAPLAALFPVGGVALVGDGGGRHLDAAGDLLSRLWHSLRGDLSDRAATAAYRAHSYAQAIVPGKSMAVFASVAALAGGGFAIDEAEQGGAPPRAAVQAPSVSTAAARITAARGSVTVARAQPAARTTAKRAPKRRARRVPRRHAAARARRHAPAAPATTRAARVQTPVPLVREPATAPTTSAAPRATAPRAPARPSRPAGEFGLETH